MDQQTNLKLQRNNLSYPYAFVYQREVKVVAPQKFIMVATSSGKRDTERGIFINFLKKSIKLLDVAIENLDKKYPDMINI